MCERERERERERVLMFENVSARVRDSEGKGVGKFGALGMYENDVKEIRKKDILKFT